ncbi:IclR family transcriptional regulator [Sphingobium fluviale]|uniref:IclR family transcriptional regulator n=1 Tax=Sphingobium fluviale TaxID=2506423 RepID=A0A4Q1KHW2_9SPHN|nr:IclR family transcriptional regulator [Sphingobium fluviale]RXR27686.1 IclR family transcriptional regulator [Sphingobium fluviale]
MVIGILSRCIAIASYMQDKACNSSICSYSEHMAQGTQSLDRALALFIALASDDGATPASEVAGTLGLAPSSARRMIAALERQGLLARIAHGRYAGGSQLTNLSARITRYRSLIETARPVLRKLAAAEGRTAHLGVYASNDMVTYLVKEGGKSLFTREGAELEAYCTGIGKALLAMMPSEQLDAYLAGNFIQLTPYTLIDPLRLKEEIIRTRQRGHAIDDREMDEGVACVAVPLSLPDATLAAISLSGTPEHFGLKDIENQARRLKIAARQISERLEHFQNDRNTVIRFENALVIESVRFPNR